MKTLKVLFFVLSFPLCVHGQSLIDSLPIPSAFFWHGKNCAGFLRETRYEDIGKGEVYVLILNKHFKLNPSGLNIDTFLKECNKNYEINIIHKIDGKVKYIFHFVEIQIK